MFSSKGPQLLLGDFRSSKTVGESIYTTNLEFFSRNLLKGEPEIPQYDWYMLLLTLLRQSLDNKSTWMTHFCENNKRSIRLICNYVQQIEQLELKSLFLSIKERAFIGEVIAIGRTQ